MAYFLQYQIRSIAYKSRAIRKGAASSRRNLGSGIQNPATETGRAEHYGRMPSRGSVRGSRDMLFLLGSRRVEHNVEAGSLASGRGNRQIRLQLRHSAGFAPASTFTPD